MGYLEIESGSGGLQHWLTLPLGEGWLVAYRLTYHGEGSRRRARIGEVRIVPGRNDPHRSEGFLPYRDYAAYEARLRAAGQWPFPPFSFKAVRRITPRLFADALAAINKSTDADFMTVPPSQIETAVPERRPGRPPVHSRVFYATFAVRYHTVEHADNREPGSSTRAILGKRYKVPITTIGKWIRTAREYGFLTKSPSRGSRGGMVTDTARAVVARGKK